MWPLLIVRSVKGGMRTASAASEAIEAEVSLKVWDVLHGTLRWGSEADGACEAGLCDLRGEVIHSVQPKPKETDSAR